MCKETDGSVRGWKLKANLQEPVEGLLLLKVQALFDCEEALETLQVLEVMG